MSSTIKLKRSLTPGAVPGSLAAGELAINIPDKKLFSSNGSSVFNVSGDVYNLSSASDSPGAKIILTVDNENLSNDAISFIGGTGIAIARNANGSITFSSTGSVSTADTLSTARHFSLSGDVTSSAVSFDGSANVVISGTTIGNEAVTTAKIQDGAVTGTKIALGTITANLVAADAVELGAKTTGNYVATVTGTANEIVVTGSGSETAGVVVGLTDNVTIPNNLSVTGNTSIGGDLVVDGNLEINGTLTYIDSTTVTIGDNLLKLANTNISDTVDTGFYSRYNDGSDKFTGLVRDATDGSYYLFDNLTTEPDQQINFGSSSQATLHATIDGGTF